MAERTEELERRREELLQDASERIAAARGERPRRRGTSGAALRRVRLRTLLLPAFAIVAMVHLGGRAGAPLGVDALFTPGTGTSFAGPRVFAAERAASPGPVTLAPGDVVGARDGEGSTLTLGDGRLVLEPGARAAVASVMPPRARLIGGTARAEGRLRVVTAHGIVDLATGSAHLALDGDGLAVRVVDGLARVISPDGEFELLSGERRRFR